MTIKLSSISLLTSGCECECEWENIFTDDITEENGNKIESHNNINVSEFLWSEYNCVFDHSHPISGWTMNELRDDV